MIPSLLSREIVRGADLAGLIRRLEARLLPGDSDRLICVGTSATLDSGDERTPFFAIPGEINQATLFAV